MVTTKQIQHAKTIFQATLDNFRDATKRHPSDKDALIDAVCNEWQGIIDDGKVIKKLSEIEDFEALLGYQREFKSKSLTAEQVIAIDKQRAAEIDLAVHIQRNHPGAPIAKLVESGKHKMPDFAAGAGKDSLYEAKYVEKYSKSAVEAIIKKGLDQIKEYVEDKGFSNAWGKVHIFTFDGMNGLNTMDVQRHIEQMVRKYKSVYQFPFEISLQVYGRAYYDFSTYSC